MTTLEPFPQPARTAASSAGAQAIIRIEALEKTYVLGEENIVRALAGVDLTITSGAFVAIMGPSGSGKSTMLNILGCLDRPTAGRYFLGGEDVSRMNDDALSEVRGRRIGFIFQSYNLIQQLTVLENIQVPLFYRGQDLMALHQRCVELAQMVGLGDRLTHRPTQLSGGQQQRVAIARALVNDPAVLLADEPTGNLDPRAAAEVMDLFRELHRSGRTILLVTHDQALAATCPRIARIEGGRIVSDVPGPRPAPGPSAAPIPGGVTP